MVFESVGPNGNFKPFRVAHRYHETVMNTLLIEEISVKIFQIKVVTRKNKRPYISKSFWIYEDFFIRNYRRKT